MSEQNLTIWTVEQLNYIEWLVLPVQLRIPKTKTEYAEQSKTSRTTLWNWEQLPGFDKERLKRIKQWQKEDTPQIIDTLKNKALTGDVSAIKTWLEWVEGTENKLQIEHSGSITVDAIKAWLNDGKQ